MNCPSCNTFNDPSTQFCMNCGRPLTGEPAQMPPLVSPSLTPRPGEWLGILTLRLLVALLGLWLLKAIVTKLSFVRELVIPEIQLTAAEIISLLVFIVMIVLLLGFARTLGTLWPQAYPRYREASLVFNALIYLVILSFAYKALRPVLIWITNDQEILMILQIILVVLAIMIIVYPCIIVYHALPGWISNIKSSFAGLKKQD